METSTVMFESMLKGLRECIGSKGFGNRNEKEEMLLDLPSPET